MIRAAVDFGTRPAAVVWIDGEKIGSRVDESLRKNIQPGRVRRAPPPLDLVNAGGVWTLPWEAP